MRELDCDSGYAET